MQNSDAYKYFDEKLTIVEKLTFRIKSTLNVTASDNKEYIKDLDNLYLQRQSALEVLKPLMRSANSINDKNLTDRIQKVVETDKSNLDNLNKKVDEIRSKLRNLAKQKSVLIYR